MNKKLVSRLELDDFDLEGDSSPKQKNVKKDPVLEKIINRFEKIFFAESYDIDWDVEDVCRVTRFSVKRLYKRCKNHVKNLGKVNNSLVQAFVDQLTYRSEKDLKKVALFDDLDESQRYYKNILGLYISALFNKTDEKSLSIDLSQISFKINCLGYKLKDKELIIVGSAGNYVGACAEDSMFEAVDFEDRAGDEAVNCKFKGQKFEYGAGSHAKCCYFEFKEAVSIGDWAQDSFFKGKIFERGGNSAKNCFFKGEVFEEPGFASENCEFHASKEIKNIAYFQRGTSKYFIKGELVDYDFDPDFNNEVNHSYLKKKKKKNE